MTIYQGSDLRKVSGGEKARYRGKRKYELGSPFTSTTLAPEERREVERTRGGNLKVRVEHRSLANVFDRNNRTAKKVRILEVLETPPNREYARREIIVKSAKIRTEAGIAQVISRPGQDGVVNAVLLSDQ